MYTSVCPNIVEKQSPEIIIVWPLDEADYPGGGGPEMVVEDLGRAAQCRGGRLTSLDASFARCFAF